jgi:hypothetical protein
MNQPGVLSAEMTQYITKGTCPRCGVAILSPDYVSQHREAMIAHALRRDVLRGLVSDRLTPAGAKVKYNGFRAMKCLTCMNGWSIDPPLHQSPGMRLGLLRTQSVFKPPATSQPPVLNLKGPVIRPTTPAATSINVANYHLIGIKDEEQIETVLRTETKTYPNGSSGRITPKVGITDSVTRSVTFESSKIKSSGSQGGIQILGFATIQGQIQKQLSERYAVQIQRTLTVSEEIQIEVPPHKAIELSITWKMIWLKGIAILGPLFGTVRAEVPYFIPQRLTFDPRTRDVPLTK